MKGSIFVKEIPAVCVSLTGRTKEEILRQAEEAARCGADMAEWRADFCDGLFDGAGVDIELEKAILAGLRTSLNGKPLLFTVRTKKEGGKADIDGAAYGEVLKAALKAGCAENAAGENVSAESTAGAVDLIDIEYSAGEKIVGEIVGLAKTAGVITIISGHDFEKTPDDETLEKRAVEMDAAGADMIKIAVAANCEEDVRRVYDLADKMKNGLVKKPYILISMGKLGKETRFDAGKLGSALTFAALTENQEAAPGQPTVSELKDELAKRHGARET